MSLDNAFDKIEGRLRQIIREEVEAALSSQLLQSEVPETCPAKELMTTKELAAFLGISPVTIYRIRKHGQIGFYRVAGRILFSHKDHVLPYLHSTTSRIGRRSKTR
jgi:excisionase family DNA binding protein